MESTVNERAVNDKVDWVRDSAANYVSIGTHEMYLRAAGPPSPSGNPVVVVITGLGESSISWTAVARHVSSFQRIYTYDRTGLGKSHSAPESLVDEPRSAHAMAQELSQLLQAAQVPSPYVLVMHSYGSIIGREFLDLRPTEVAGVVFVEANSESSYKVRPENLVVMLSLMLEGMDEHEIMATDRRHKMTAEEWAAFKKKDSPEEQQQHRKAAMAEYLELENSCDGLSEKMQLEKRIMGTKPVSVIKGEELKDVRKVLDESVKRGKRLPECHSEVRRWLKMDAEETRLQRENLRLSTNVRFTNARLSGHDVHLTEPEVIAEEIKWVLLQCTK